MKVTVGHVLVDKCTEKAKSVVHNNTTKNFKEKYSKGLIDANRNIEICRAAFIAECAACIFLGLNPFNAVTWKTSTKDPGFDLVYDGKTIDVKASDNPGARRLIWPVTKRFVAANILILARVLRQDSCPLGQDVHLDGWVTRERFAKDKQISDGKDRLVLGTAFMMQEHLDPMENLISKGSSPPQAESAACR